MITTEQVISKFTKISEQELAKWKFKSIPLYKVREMLDFYRAETEVNALSDNLKEIYTVDKLFYALHQRLEPERLLELANAIIAAEEQRGNR